VKTTETGHGRVEERTYTFCDDLSCLLNPGDWAEIAMLVKVDAHITDKKTGESTESTRYYITSCKDMKRVAAGIRSHWGVESMHWILDVVFGEDLSTKRSQNSAENFNIISKMATNILRNDGVDYGKKRVSVRRRMLKASFEEQYLELLISLL
jgi:predicted transposase YbfD/YdcC